MTDSQPIDIAQALRDAWDAVDLSSPRPTYEAYGVWQVA